MADLSRLQEVLNEIRVKKRRRTDISKSFKDELAQHDRYQAIIEEMETLKAEKKGIEQEMQNRTPREAAELEDLKIEIKADEELLSDMAMTLIMQEEQVELVDEDQNRYVPELKVKFKKDGTVDAKEEKGKE